MGGYSRWELRLPIILQCFSVTISLEVGVILGVQGAIGGPGPCTLP